MYSTYLGHQVNAEGIQAMQEKIAAIERATECSTTEVLFRPFELLPEVSTKSRSHHPTTK